MLFLFGMMILMSCDNSDNHDSPQEYAGVPLVILDTDIGSSTDDLFAMEMLYRYEEQGKCRLLGVVVDREGEQNAAFADVMNTYFGHGDVPIGLVRKGIEKPVIWIDYAHVADKQGSDGKPMFRRTVTDYSTLPDGWQLYRRLLAAQPDHSVSIVSTGFVTSLAQLLQSEGDDYSPLSGVELVRQKVKGIYMQGGVFGEAVDYTPEQVIGDVSWTDVHPIKQVYMNCNCDTGQRMWDVMPTIQAVEGDDLFTLSERGTVTVTLECATIFTPSATGNCRYQIAGDGAWAAAMLEKVRSFNKIH